jgi:hypothetical protein
LNTYTEPSNKENPKMMRIETNVTNADDCFRAAAAFTALAHVFGDDTEQTEAAPRATRTRRTAKTDPVAAYNAIAEATGGRTFPTEPPAADPAPDIQAPSVSESDSTPAPAAPPAVDREALVAQFRDMAQARGILWLRPILQGAGVDKLSLLTDAQMVDGMAAAQMVDPLA